MCLWPRESGIAADPRSEEHTSELQSQSNLVCRLLLEKKTRARVQARQRASTSGIRVRARALRREGSMYLGTRLLDSRASGYRVSSSSLRVPVRPSGVA